MYAQTNLQLLNQLRREGYSEVDLRLIRNAYELSTRLYAAYFTGSGRTQIAHVVGTASILSSAHAPTEVVAASLLHNVYENGDFGSPRQGITAAKRKEVSQVVGAEVEKYVYRFRELRMKSKIAFSLLSGTEMLDDLSRHALVIELAERLEHWLNYEGRGYMTRNGRLMIQAANELGFAALAGKIQEALEKTNRDQRLEDLIHRARGLQSDFLVPPSYRRRLWIGALSGFRYMRSSLRIHTRVRRTIQAFRTAYSAK